MFTISYSQLVENSFYSDYSVHYMTGLKVIDMSHAKAVINVDSKVVFIYSE